MSPNKKVPHSECGLCGQTFRNVRVGAPAPEHKYKGTNDRCSFSGQPTVMPF
ncbi:hypothetical protein [Nonomuraea sp. JJY05]|uniref:hypothetical protein n=1 Tax=Nonomuraea sp. JJY05 TaxID=3350255 RepID=UPI00373F0DC3